MTESPSQPQPPHLEEELLHRYFDGELQKSEALTVRGHLGSCPQCSARHQQLSALRRLITVAAEQSTLDVDFDRAFGRIEQAVRAQPAAREQGLFERLRDWLEETLRARPERIWAPALGALAAAALLYALARSDQPEIAKQPPPAVQPEEAVAQSAGAKAAGEQPEGTEPSEGLPEDALAMASSEVVQVDFGDDTGTVFEIAVADGVSTPVVWINDDE